MNNKISVIIPAYNEADTIGQTIERIKATAASESWDLELIVIDDGSVDDTGKIAAASGSTVIRHPTNGGYGLSLQDGIRFARHPFVAITDADGTYPVEELPKLYNLVAEQGFDMSVGKRTGIEYKKGLLKYPARVLFRWLAEYVAGRRIPDVNSGLRVIRREKLLPHLSRTCLGFSFTTSITLIFFLNGFFVTYLPVAYSKRVGQSKVRHFHDTLRTGQIMFSIIARYNPLKLFLLLAGLTFLSGLIFAALSLFRYYQTWLIATSATLVGAAPIIFSLGCLAELIRLIGSRDRS